MLATATAKWETLDARSEIHGFTDSLNEIGNGYTFGKDFVLKACLYLSENLPIQYKVKNFTRTNLRLPIEFELAGDTVSPLCNSTIDRSVWVQRQKHRRPAGALAGCSLPAETWQLVFRHVIKIGRSGRPGRYPKVVRISTLKNAFGGSSDTTLTRLRELLVTCNSATPFPTAQGCSTLYTSE